MLKIKKKVMLLKCKGGGDLLSSHLFSQYLLKMIQNSKHFFHSPKCRFSSKRKEKCIHATRTQENQQNASIQFQIKILLLKYFCFFL